MQAEQFGRGFVLVIDDVFFVVGLSAYRRHTLGFIDVELILTREHVRVNELAYESLNKPFVFAISHAAALVDFGR